MSNTNAANANSKAKATKTPAEERIERMKNEQFRQALNQEREDLGLYAERGCFYASHTPIGNAVGAELGFVTRDGDKVSRTGIGFYIRSDHMSQVPYLGTVDI